VLARAGAIRGSRRGREHVWELDPSQLAEARRYLESISRDWDDALSRLKDFVERYIGPGIEERVRAPWRQRAMTVEIRPMRVDDLSRVAELSAQLGYPVSRNHLEDRFSRLVDAGHSLLVAQSEGRVIGWIHVHLQLLLESEPHAEIAALVVEASARRHGAGRALVLEAERWSRQHGIERLRVRSNITRHEAHLFYPSLGFTTTKTQHNYELRLA